MSRVLAAGRRSYFTRASATRDLGLFAKTFWQNKSSLTEIKFVGRVAEPRLDRTLIREAKAGFVDPALQFANPPS
jgi:hypothetical protein